MSATILPFPQSPSAVRRHNRTEGLTTTAGLLSLLLLDRDGEPIPANVQRFDEPEGAQLPERSPELLLCLLIFNGLPQKRRDQIRRGVRALAYSGRPDPVVVSLNNMLRQLGTQGRGGAT